MLCELRTIGGIFPAMNLNKNN